MRITREEMFMQMAEVTAKRSTCYRNAVGCLIVRDNLIVSSGYNGTPTGEPHCLGTACTEEGVCWRATHAEANAFNRLQNRNRVSAVYVTTAPCPYCAELIRRLSPDKVYYRHPYRLTEGVDFLVEAGIQVYRMTTSGYLFDENLKQLVDE